MKTDKKGLYRVELIEKTEKYGDIARISSPTPTEKELINKVLYFKKEFKKQIEQEKYYINIIYVNIKY